MLFDVAATLPALKPDKRLKTVTGDIADAAAIRRLIDPRTGSVFHFAAVRFGYSRTLLLPAISATVAEMVEGLRRAGGEAAVKRIRWEPDPVIQKIVAAWPRAIVAKRAESLGTHADASMDEIVQAFVEDDLAAQKAMAAG